ncbi:hypothetical protein I4U23_021353 [Adineta vaga]|nr:hypothetical protein I4U23_021353 [Adineta vaga]
MWITDDDGDFEQNERFHNHQTDQIRTTGRDGNFLADMKEEQKRFYRSVTHSFKKQQKK